MATTNQNTSNLRIPIPPKSPDIELPPSQHNPLDLINSYKDKLLGKIQSSNETPNEISPSPMSMDLSHTTTVPDAQRIEEHRIKSIALSDEDIQRIYEPWKFSMIIKLIGKRVLHHYLKVKIQNLWRPTENFSLIDLGEDYYTVKFNKEENSRKTLQNGPWFINGFFLSVPKWTPNFVATKATQSYTDIWIRFPQLPIEFYDGVILAKIGNAIGKLLKIDACTSFTIRGRYARLCVQIPLEQTVQSYIKIGSHK
ncbi:uncharacterized protein [Nicotiana sylvestris]|uniref:uncharacterized protein n=1 Tax=Nicotiana sylvestris TaxID=4096 RepID=UPI00388CC0FB